MCFPVPLHKAIHMNLKKIPKEEFPNVAKDVVDCNLDFKRVAKKWDISEMVVINIFQKYGSGFIKKTDVEQRLEDLTTDYFDKQKVFIQKSHDVKVLAVERIETLLRTETNIDNISKAINILDNITRRYNETEGDDEKGDKALTL